MLLVAGHKTWNLRVLSQFDKTNLSFNHMSKEEQKNGSSVLLLISAFGNRCLDCVDSKRGE